ncbi:hypothetical protein Nocox_10105 [Nonomuraea coxensis DSM 45129]|uniref:NUDIX hydrolase n=1 Tax=Nonomuraea coxensis DSM 45129 TaxID=1122611 RepID=A0ABX8TWJ0_9ACTN|nr:hypothetical protein Nocox_10105 [Nonomuraea coxensis DSM 45129]
MNLLAEPADDVHTAAVRAARLAYAVVDGPLILVRCLADGAAVLQR